MTYRKINVRKEVLADLRRMAKGREPKWPPFLVAKYAARQLGAVVDSDEVDWLSRLYLLPDTRA